MRVVGANTVTASETIATLQVADGPSPHRVVIINAGTTNPLWINFDATASATAGFPLAPGASIELHGTYAQTVTGFSIGTDVCVLDYR